METTETYTTAELQALARELSDRRDTFSVRAEVLAAEHAARLDRARARRASAPFRSRGLYAIRGGRA